MASEQGLAQNNPNPRVVLLHLLRLLEHPTCRLVPLDNTMLSLRNRCYPSSCRGIKWKRERLELL
jgi:hypothetical protein